MGLNFAQLSHVVRRRQRRTVGVLAALMPMVLLSACGSSGGSSSAGGMDDVTIVASHYPTNMPSLPYMVGMTKGFFKQQHINLEKPIPAAGGGDSVRAITSGDIDFGDVSGSGFIQAAMAGAPLVALGTSTASMADLVWVTRKDAPYSSLKDYCGHGVWGISKPGSVTDMLTGLMMDAQGIDKSCVKVVAAGEQAASLVKLRAGDIDAVPLTQPLATTELAKGDLKVVQRSVDVVPDYPQTLLVASSRLVKANPSLARRFMTAMRKSQQFIYAHPDEAGQIFAKGAGIDEKTAVDVVNQIVKIQNYYSEALTTGELKYVISGMEHAGLYNGKDPIPWDDILEQQFIPANERVKPADLPGYQKK